VSLVRSVFVSIDSMPLSVRSLREVYGPAFHSISVHRLFSGGEDTRQCRALQRRSASISVPVFRNGGNARGLTNGLVEEGFTKEGVTPTRASHKAHTSPLVLMRS